MKKFSLALLALAMALAITPAALADSFIYTFSSPKLASGGSVVLATGNLTGTSVSKGIFDITSGTITIAGSGNNLIMGSGNIIGSAGSQLTSPSGAFYYDNQIFLPPSVLPFVDNWGLLFKLDSGVEVNIFSTSPFAGAGMFSYLTWEGSSGPNWNFSNDGVGEFNIYDLTPPVPEPSSLLLLGTGLLGLALVLFRKAKPSHSMTFSM